MTVQQKIISNKVGLLNLAEELGNISKACRIQGFSRDTFYRYRDAVASGGLDALTEKSRRKPNVKNRIDEAIEAQVVKMAIDEPAFGQKRAANELRKIGVFLSPAGVRCIWLRHDLETFQKRLTMLEQKMAETNGILTESQMAALEKKQQEKEAHGEIETEHPGYLGSQDTFFVGTLKGVAAFISKRSWTRIHAWHARSSTIRRRQSPRRICSMIVSCHCLKITVWICSAF